MYHKSRSYYIRFLRCKVQQGFLSFWAIFCPFPLLTTPKINISKNEKNNRQYYHFTLVQHRWPYHAWFLRYGALQTEFFVILDHFLPFYPPNNLENQDFERMQKMPGDIILYMYTINKNQMMPGSWDIEHDRQHFLSFWAIFCPSTQLTTWKSKFWKSEKKNLEISSFYTCVTQMAIIWCFEIWSATKRVLFHFGHFLPFYSPKNPENSYFSFSAIFGPFTLITVQKI